MNKLLKNIALVVAALAIFTGTVSAAAPNLSVNNAYLKSGGSYDVVVKEKAGDKLGLYVNDKNPVYATVNKQGWATFHHAKLGNKDKLSFTHVYGSTKNQKPINFVRYFTASGNKASFTGQNPNAQTSQKVEAVTAAPAAAPPVQTQTSTSVAPATPTYTAPASSCTNGSYVNSAGNTVCSPETAPSAPDGATAQCVDGTYSFSQTHSGTCSHHGGVAQWL